MEGAAAVIDEVEERFAATFGRRYPGLLEAYRTDDADFVVVTLGSVAGLVREQVDRLRADGMRAGMVRLRYLRPFPYELLAKALGSAKAVGVLEKDVSFGAEGTVMTNVSSALHRAALTVPTLGFVGGLGGDDITAEQVRGIFARLEGGAKGPVVSFLGIEDERGDAL